MQLLRVAPDDPRLPESVAKASLNASGLHKCVFYEVHQPGILKTDGSDGSVILCKPVTRKRRFREFVVLTKMNATAPGTWDVRALMSSSSMPPNIVVSFLVSMTGPSWSELATPLDQHGCFSEYGRPADLLPNAGERAPEGLNSSEKDYRWMLNVLDPDETQKVKDGGVKVGPKILARHFGVVPSHMPEVFYLDGECFVQYKTHAEVLIVYGIRAASTVLQRYIEVDGMPQPVPGCKIDGAVVTLTLALHFNLARGRSVQMWNDVRGRAADILYDEAAPFLAKAASGELMAVMNKNADGEEPTAREICAAHIVLAIAERKRHRLANAGTELGKLPPCLKLDPQLWYSTNNVHVRRQQLFTMTGLRAMGHEEMADNLRTLIQFVYDNAYQPKGVSDAEFRQKQQSRNSIFRKTTKMYPSPKCGSHCPLPHRCQHELPTVAEVIIANAQERLDKENKDRELEEIMGAMEC